MLIQWTQFTKIKDQIFLNCGIMPLEHVLEKSLFFFHYKHLAIHFKFLFYLQ